MHRQSLFLAFILAAATTLSTGDAFAPVATKPTGIRVIRETTRLNFGIPTFQPKKDDKNKKDDNKFEPLPKKEMSLGALVQLITAGAGAPFLGDYEGVDKETGKFMFSLEANNLVDENGNSKQTQMPYFENGWVDPEDEKRAAEGFKWPWQK
jgi:hypothetical protein